jgi:hypothetical protein
MVSFPVSEWPTRRLPCYPMHRGLDYIAANSITLSRGAADRREHRQAAGADAEAVASIMIVAWQLIPRRLVPRIGPTRVAVPGPGGQALLKR